MEFIGMALKCKLSIRPDEPSNIADKRDFAW
jgi:hypothetical protein